MPMRASAVSRGRRQCVERQTAWLLSAVADLEELARRAFQDAWRTGSIGAVDRFFSPEVAERIRQNVELIRGAFPDFAPLIESVTVNGETAAVRWVGRGTHTGVFAGLQPTGRAISVSGVSIYMFKGNTIVDRRSLWDMLALLQQLEGAA